MQLKNLKKEPSPSSADLKSFGLIVSSIFIAIATFVPWAKKESVHIGFVATMAVGLLLSFVAPRALSIPYKIWMSIGTILGQVNNYIILTFIYYFLICPAGCIVRLLGRRKMELKIDPEVDSYRTTRSTPYNAQDMENPY